MSNTESAVTTTTPSEQRNEPHQRKELFSSFHWDGHFRTIHKLASQGHLEGHKKRYHRKVLFTLFQFNGHNSGFDSKTKGWSQFTYSHQPQKGKRVISRTSSRSDAPAFVSDYSGREDFLRLVPLLLSKLSCLAEKKIPTAINIHGCLNVPWIKPSISLKAVKGYNGLDDERTTITQRCTKSMKRLT